MANDAAVDDGGIILNSSDGNKTFIWKDGTDSWTSSENIDLASGKGIKINTNSVLTETALGASVTSASRTYYNLWNTKSSNYCQCT